MGLRACDDIKRKAFDPHNLITGEGRGTCGVGKRYNVISLVHMFYINREASQSHSQTTPSFTILHTRIPFSHWKAESLVGDEDGNDSLTHSLTLASDFGGRSLGCERTIWVAPPTSREISVKRRGRYLTTPIFGGRRAASEEISVLKNDKNVIIDNEIDCLFCQNLPLSLLTHNTDICPR